MIIFDCHRYPYHRRKQLKNFKKAANKREGGGDVADSSYARKGINGLRFLNNRNAF